MRSATPRAALALLIHRSLILAGVIVQCPVCLQHYETSDPRASYPHNNH
ncbi:hypothetical protein IDM40_08395 [Nocardiopsis sp. HNM0947]|uniref:Uncharacterized protein n=1 Tax=Nocardiopsis coralli TaxID=2772213 RepID=A0ABR9P4F4_9ACTN|nr:hypothetical protein [Nocardiopsis coralli]MBE2998720.1 hypothetical protein [Nocardiopsis coralli]